jgi:hypothetical protein
MGDQIPENVGDVAEEILKLINKRWYLFKK